MPDWFKNGFVRLLNPVVGFLVRHRVHPNLISTFGFLYPRGAILIFQRSIIAGVVVFLLGGMMDILDGRVARETGLASKFGSFYDSTLDRVGDRRLLLAVRLLPSSAELLVGRVRRHPRDGRLVDGVVYAGQGRGAGRGMQSRDDAAPRARRDAGTRRFLIPVFDRIAPEWRVRRSFSHSL